MYMYSTVYTGHKNATNVTPQHKNTHKENFKKQNGLKLKSVLQVVC